MIRVGILGAKGYTAGELMRLLAGHAQATTACLMARVDGPEPVEHYFPSLRGQVKVPIEPIDPAALADRCDAVFLAMPHTVAQEYAPALIAKGIKVVDLSADFRFESVELYEKTYKVKHLAPELNAKIPYGLPELWRESLRGAPGIANPGCHTITAILGLAPLMKHGDILDLDRIAISSLTGISGGGRKPTDRFHFPECNESCQAYGVAGHRHRPEIEEQLGRLAGRALHLVFTPILVPMNRGILSCSTVPLRPGASLATAQALDWFRDIYRAEPFVRVLPEGEVPATAAVAMTNFCDIGVMVDHAAATLLVFSATDNLVKGASGQAMQNMNLLFGLPETMGILPG
jgi:N-acetyl-gamma-glutamyl-phosphate reductase